MTNEKKIHVLADETLGGIKREYEETNHGYGGVVSLKPTDIVRLREQRFRLVDRKAEVGERVIQTSTYNGDLGRVSEVTSVCYDGSGVIANNPLLHCEYRVLVPVESETSPQSTEDIIANLVARVAQLERENERQAWKIVDLEQGIGGVKDDIETWAQEHTELAHKFARIADKQFNHGIDIGRIDDKIEMCIDDIATLDERTEHVNTRRCCACQSL